MLLTPVLLTLATLHAIRRIILDLLPMICSASLALAAGSTANKLMRVIAGRREGVVTVGAPGSRHFP